MIGLGLMLLIALMAKRQNLPVASEKATWRERGQATKAAFWPLLTPVIILGGILGGVFTPTEASAIAVLYTLIVGMFVLRTVKLKDIPDIFTTSAKSSAVVLLLVGAALAFKTVVSLSHAAESMAEWTLGISENPLVLLFLINILLFVVGMFLDAGPAIIILGPILAPVFVSLGIDPVHFAIIMSVNLTVGLATPPMAGALCGFQRIRRKSRNAFCRDPAVSGRGSDRDFPDYVFPVSFHDYPALVRTGLSLGFKPNRPENAGFRLFG